MKRNISQIKSSGSQLSASKDAEEFPVQVWFSSPDDKLDGDFREALSLYSELKTKLLSSLLPPLSWLKSVVAQFSRLLEYIVKRGFWEFHSWLEPNIYMLSKDLESINEIIIATGFTEKFKNIMALPIAIEEAPSEESSPISQKIVSLESSSESSSLSQKIVSFIALPGYDYMNALAEQSKISDKALTLKESFAIIKKETSAILNWLECYQGDLLNLREYQAKMAAQFSVLSKEIRNDIEIEADEEVLSCVRPLLDELDQIVEEIETKKADDERELRDTLAYIEQFESDTKRRKLEFDSSSSSMPTISQNQFAFQPSPLNKESGDKKKSQVTLLSSPK